MFCISTEDATVAETQEGVVLSLLQNFLIRVNKTGSDSSAYAYYLTIMLNDKFDGSGPSVYMQPALRLIENFSSTNTDEAWIVFFLRKRPLGFGEMVWCSIQHQVTWAKLTQNYP